MRFRKASVKRPAPVRVPLDGDLDISGLGQALWYKKWRILIPTLMAAVLSLVVVNAMTPRYKSEARILLENKENVFLRAEAEKNVERASLDPEAVASQIQLVLSRDLARQVIKNEHLADKPEFDPLVGGVSLSRTILGLFGLGRDPLGMSPEERVLESYYERLNAFAVEKTRVIVVEFSSADAELAARVANAIASGYLSMQQSAKQSQTRAASDWLAHEIASMRTKVADAETKVEEYRAKSNLYVGANNSSLPNQQLSEVNSQISAARAQKADLEARARELRQLLKSGRTIDSSDVANSDSMRRLIEQRNVFRAQLAEQSTTLLDQHPRIKELRAQIGEVDAQIRAEGERLARAMDNDAKVAGNRIETLTASLNQVKKLASQSNEQDLQLRALERESKAQRDLLESYLAKYREASARENINAAPADARVISRASAAIKPTFPKKMPIVLIVSLAMFTLATVFVATGELLAPTMLTYPTAAAEVDAPRREPAIDMSSRKARRAAAKAKKAQPAPAPAVAVEPAAAPIAPLARLARAVRGGPAAPAALTIDQIAAELKEAGDEGRRATVVGTMRNVGTTFAAISIARALARDSRVCLVDFDFNSPNLSVISTDPDAPGIADLARGTASFGDIITADQFSSVHLIAAGDVGADALALAASPILAVTMEALVRAYDHVLIDVGAATQIEPERFAPLAPRAVLVAADAGKSTAQMRDQLLAAGFDNVSLVIGGAGAAAAA
ncbi:MAG: lipopolysaccharide biosynthesis protein [Pseudolabrys sp.]|nr:lipopolysaccharide biosynthesis protein [Pseudolabrys sp.]MCW5686482.1 lipopolysaccharide biosynthesis protein [Pseudolabrys sp.]